MGFGPRTYLVGQLLPLMLRDMAAPVTATTAEKLDEAIRLSLYIADLTLARMGKQIVHDWEENDAKTM
jgi:hypothetical protein